MDNRGNSRANTCEKTASRSLYLLDKKLIQVLPVLLVNHNNCSNRKAQAGDSSFKFLPYQLSTVV